jgi:hypothetical protein
MLELIQELKVITEQMWLHTKGTNFTTLTLVQHKLEAA